MPNSDILVSEYGDIKYNNKIYKSSYNTDGYKAIRLPLNGIRVSYRIHRMVAITYLPNIENKLEVNHKDGNKINNHYSNLEWCTHAENIKHAWDTGLLNSNEIRSKKLRDKCSHYGIDNHYSKPVIGVTKWGIKTEQFECMREAAKYYKTDSSQISKSANNNMTKQGTKRSAGKLDNKPIFWEFINEL